MTAIMPEQPTATDLRPLAEIWPAEGVNLGELKVAILDLLCDHGLGDVTTVKVDITPIRQGGCLTGLTISGLVYERPAELGSGMTREEYDAAMLNGSLS